METTRTMVDWKALCALGQSQLQYDGLIQQEGRNESCERPPEDLAGAAKFF